MAERPLVSVSLAFVAGLLLGEAFFYFPLTLIGLTLILLLFEILYARRTLLSFPCLFVAAVAFLFIQWTAKPPLPDDLRAYVDRGPIRILAKITEAPRPNPSHTAFQMEGIARFAEAWRPVKGSFQVTLWGETRPYRYGDRLDLVISLRRPTQYQNLGSLQYADYRERTGSSGVAHLSDLSRVNKVGEGGHPILIMFFRWREDIQMRLRSTLSPQTAALVSAFVLGEPGHLSDEVRETFAAAGVAHLLAVSGAHLAFVSLLVFGLSRWLILRLPAKILLRISLWKLPSQWAAGVTGGAAFFYTLLAGAHLGTLRALTMILIYLFSIWIGRRRDAKISLSIAALLILIVQPRAIFEISFQLSFLAVAAMILILEGGEIEGGGESDDSNLDALEAKTPFFKKQIIGRAQLLFRSTLAATLGTAPLTLFYFHQFSWSGLIANLILLPLAGWVMVPIGLLSALAALIFKSGLPFPVAQEGLWSFFTKIIAFFAELPAADVHFASPPILSLVIYYVVLFYGIGLKNQGNEQKRRRWVYPLIGGFFLFFLGWGGLRIPPEGPRFTFLDVGQGDASFIEFSNGKTMLVDGGGKQAGKLGVAPYLWERGIRTIDYLVVSHPQADHVGGLPYLMRRFKVKELWSTGRDQNGSVFRPILQALAANKGRHRILSSERPEIKIDDCRLKVLHPSGEGRMRVENKNNRSLVLRLSCPGQGREGISLLFTGDIEAEGEAALMAASAPLRSTILKVPHHGSRSSSGRDFISAVSPDIATISAGRNNGYRHPHPEVIAAYDSHGTRIYRTDHVGAIVIETAKDKNGNPSIKRLWSYRDRKVQGIRWDRSVLTQEWGNIEKFFTLSLL